MEGFAPTSRAAQKLGEAGIETSTLQMHLARGQKPDTGEKRLYVLDESSLASTKQMHEFVTRLHPNDRVLLVGDRRQHEAVDAGKPFAQLQEAGMKTISLDQIVRQKDPELRNVVEQLARGEVGAAVKNLDEQGRVHEFRGREERIDAIAKEYAKSPENTLVVSPDNRSRAEINGRIHAELQDRGVVSREEHRVQTLVPRQDLTGAARTWAERYEVGDVLRYSRASKETGIGKGEYARVMDVTGQQNRITVELNDGTERSYDPQRQSGVSVYREEERSFSAGDRIQFTAPANELKVANRELGTVEGITEGRMALRMDDGRSVADRSCEASASRSWLCRDQSLQPGADRRACARPCRYRAGRERPAEQPHGVCGRLAWQRMMRSCLRMIGRSCQMRLAMMFQGGAHTHRKLVCSRLLQTWRSQTGKSTPMSLG